MRHLVYALPQHDEPALLTLVENDGTFICRYESPDGSFRQIGREGRTFRLNGRDRDTGESVYVETVV